MNTEQYNVQYVPINVKSHYVPPLQTKFTKFRKDAQFLVAFLSQEVSLTIYEF